MMGTGKTALTVLLTLACGCTIIHDLDPDGLPVRDGADDATDGVLDADGTDPAGDPDHEGDPVEDCTATVPFEPTCPGSVSCPEHGDLPSTCNVTLIQFTSSTLEGAFQYRDHGVTDACASLCECPGFIKMQVDADTEHTIEGGEFSTPAVSYISAMGTSPFTITTRIIDGFLDSGQEAGLYVWQDEANVLFVTVSRSGDTTELFIDLDQPSGGGYMHPDTLPGSSTDVTLSVQRTDETTWYVIINGTSRLIAHSFSLNVSEVGIAVGNFSGAPMTAALFDYVCINEP